MIALGGLVFCGVGGAALWLGVAASGGLAAVGSNWEQVSSFFFQKVSFGYDNHFKKLLRDKV